MEVQGNTGKYRKVQEGTVKVQGNTVEVQGNTVEIHTLKKIGILPNP